MADATELPPFRPLPQKAPDVEMRTAPGGIHYIAARHAPGPRLDRPRLSAQRAPAQRSVVVFGTFNVEILKTLKCSNVEMLKC